MGWIYPEPEEEKQWSVATEDRNGRMVVYRNDDTTVYKYQLFGDADADPVPAKPDTREVLWYQVGAEDVESVNE